MLRLVSWNLGLPLSLPWTVYYLEEMDIADLWEWCQIWVQQDPLSQHHSVRSWFCFEFGSRVAIPTPSARLNACCSGLLEHCPSLSHRLTPQRTRILYLVPGADTYQLCQKKGFWLPTEASAWLTFFLFSSPFSKKLKFVPAVVGTSQTLWLLKITLEEILIFFLA